MANNFLGYLVKAANGTVLDRYIQKDTFNSTPDQRQDSDSYRDGTGVLHRNVLPAVATTLKFSTLMLDLDEKIAFQSAINSGRTSVAERKTTLTYWNDERNVYCADTFYIPDMDFKISYIADGTIYYDKLECKFIGYGEVRT